jgi:delta-aminolevulinic acid dehydratase/porphobilinogen synthase
LITNIEQLRIQKLTLKPYQIFLKEKKRDRERVQSIGVLDISFESFERILERQLSHGFGLLLLFLGNQFPSNKQKNQSIKNTPLDN